jgi:GNAT superfamily N-acetyltransferase
MEVRSLGLGTDLALIATRGRVLDRGSYLVALTPDDPGDYHGNMLVLPGPPRPGELASWLERFAREVAIDPAIRHVTLCWDDQTTVTGVAGAAGAADELTRAGFELATTHVMTARAVRAPAAPRDIELRPLAADELARAAELAFALGNGRTEAYRQFLHRRAAWQRDLVTRGAARFWGAFDDRTLVGSLGLVRIPPRGRYQDVQTAPSHRRRGIASALLAVAAAEACADGIAELVIRTGSGSEAEQVYGRAGFCTIERTVSACRAPAITG